jgi:hypothetical protein
MPSKHKYIPCANQCGVEIRKSGSKSGLCAGCLNAQRRRTEATPAPTPITQSPIAESSFEVHGDQGIAKKTTHEKVRTLADLVRVCEIDTDEWEVERWVANKWEMGAKLGEKGAEKIEVTPLYQVKAWLRRKVAVIGVREEIAELKALAKRDIEPRIIRGIDWASGVLRQSDAPYLLELMIPDLHVGNLAWAKETGWANYDSNIARETFERALDALVQRTASYRFSGILFPVGNDLFHADNMSSTTTKGTQLQTDVRFQRTFGIVRTMIIDAIEKLRAIAPVKVVIVPGNHDQLTAWHLGDSLECYYHKAADVEIDNEPKVRKYVEYGKTMLMLTHGDKGKHKDYPSVMAAEEAEMWGRTKYREAHTGHLHHERTNEYHGCKVRIFSALTAVDTWHAENQFVGQNRRAEALVWHKDEGLVGTALYTVQKQKD